MAVAREAHALRLDVLRFDARLIEPLREAMVVLAMVAAVHGHQQHRDVLEILQLPRRFLLHVAGDLVGRRRLGFERRLQLLGIANRGLVSDRTIRNAPAQPAALAVGDLRSIDSTNRRCRRFERRDRLDKVLPRVRDEPAECSAL